MKFRESALAHRLLDGLEGIEIGGAAHNPFGLKTRNVDVFSSDDTIYKEAERKNCGEALQVDLVAPGDNIPLPDNSADFVISSHVIEHFPDPIRALKEWRRIVRPGGYIYVIGPHKERTFDKDRPRTTLAELIERHQNSFPPETEDKHWSVWITEDFVELINYLGWPIVEVQDVDDKVGNGFAIVIGVEKADAAVPRVVKKERLSMTFLMGPTHTVPTGESACILEYAKRLHARGHHVSIATWPKFLWPAAEPFPGLDVNVPIYYDRGASPQMLPFHLATQTPRNHLGEMQFFMAYLSLLMPAIPKADLLIAANWDCILPAWQSGRGKVVHFAEHYDEVFFAPDGDPSAGLQGNQLLKLMCRTTFQMPIYRIANSSWLSDEFRKRTGQTVPFVNHGVDAGDFAPLPKLSERDGILRVVTYSGPEKWKGFQDALAAMHEVMRRHSGRIEWHVYGFANPDFPPGNALAPYTFHQTLNRDQLSKLHAESDMVLCPSWYESFPLPPIEGMASGTAVITTPYGTEDYAFDGDTAMVVRPRVISDFVNAIDALIRMPDLRARLAAKGRAMAESLTWDRAVDAREKLLWQIHRNETPCTSVAGFDSGISDGYGIPLEQITPDTPASEGDLLRGADGRDYVVEYGRLRHVVDPTGAGLDASHAASIDLLNLMRNVRGPDITSLANFHGVKKPAKV